jgi:hypothetical protein
MRPGPDRIIVCPHCEYKSRIRTLLSGNTLGARRWTDGKEDFPSLPQDPPIIRCMRCRSFFWLENAKSIGEERNYPFRYIAQLGGFGILFILVVFILEETGVFRAYAFTNVLRIIFFISLSCISAFILWSIYKACKRIRPLSEKDIFLAIEKKVWSNLDEEKHLRLLAWWKANDRFRYKKKYRKGRSEMTLFAKSEVVENLKNLFKLLDPSLSHERLLKAEIKRELGDFNEAQKWLEMDISEKDKEMALIIKKAIEKQNTTVKEVSIPRV